MNIVQFINNAAFCYGVEPNNHESYSIVMPLNDKPTFALPDICSYNEEYDALFIEYQGALNIILVPTDEEQWIFSSDYILFEE